MVSRRLTVLIVAISVTYAALLFHLYQVQLLRGSYYTARAESQYAASHILTAKRGSIYFTGKNNNQLAAAANKDFPFAYAVPKAIEDPQKAAEQISPILELPLPNLINQLSKKNDSYEPLKKKLDDATAQKIEDLKIKGIYIEDVPERFYPLGTLGAHILGFLGPNAKDANESGHYGLEEFYESRLAGKEGQTQGNKIIDPEAGEDIALTVDPNIQTEAERILDNLVKSNNAGGGSIIVEDPETGKILAMGSFPNFDPNNYGESNVADFLNPSVQHVYEPGSVFKVLTMAAGIDAGKLTPDTTYVDKGTVTMNGKTISNYDFLTHGAYGLATMTNVIEHSINTGAVFAEGKTGNDVFASYLKKFGLDQRTGIDLPGELAGNLKRLSPKAPQVAFATASYGQGVAITPIELINAIAAIANGGNLMRPYLNAALQPKVMGRVISANTAKQVTGMMISAVDKAQVAAIKGYSLAGKTGTAFIPDLVHGGYTDDVIDSYVGFGPAVNPRFIALVKIDDLPSTALAAQTVVPAFRDLAQFILNYYNVPPDRIGK